MLYLSRQRRFETHFLGANFRLFKNFFEDPELYMHMPDLNICKVAKIKQGNAKRFYQKTGYASKNSISKVSLWPAYFGSQNALTQSIWACLARNRTPMTVKSLTAPRNLTKPDSNYTLEPSVWYKRFPKKKGGHSGIKVKLRWNSRIESSHCRHTLCSYQPARVVYGRTDHLVQQRLMHHNSSRHPLQIERSIAPMPSLGALRNAGATTRLQSHVLQKLGDLIKTDIKGKAKKTQSGFSVCTFKDIIRCMRYALSDNLFSVGTHIFSRLKGHPMGGSFSELTTLVDLGASVARCYRSKECQKMQGCMLKTTRLSRSSRDSCTSMTPWFSHTFVAPLVCGMGFRRSGQRTWARPWRRRDRTLMSSPSASRSPWSPLPRSHPSSRFLPSIQGAPLHGPQHSQRFQLQAVPISAYPQL